MTARQAPTFAETDGEPGGPRAAGQPTTAVRVVSASGRPIPQEQLELIEALDDAVFAALDGDADALDRAPGLWRKTRRLAAGFVLEESRRQYVRRAKSVWRQSRCDPGRRLAAAFAAEEVLGLVGLAGESPR